MWSGRTAQYAWLLAFGVAFGYFEAAVVIDLRELYYPAGFRFPVVLIPARLAGVELAREAASLVVLAAASRLAAARFLERFAAFMLLFGLWDIFYYVFLWLLLGWPASLTDWDVLFLIPVPWVGPVWAPLAVSLALVAVGSHVFLTAARPRVLRPGDWALAIAAGAIVIASMLAGWRIVPEQRVPDGFPAGVFWAGLALGLLVYLRVERRTPAAVAPR